MVKGGSSLTVAARGCITLGNSRGLISVFLARNLESRGSHAPAKNSAGDSIACPVCGSTDSQLVVDLGEQPFANHFVNDTEEATLLRLFTLARSGLFLGLARRTGEIDRVGGFLGACRLARRKGEIDRRGG